MRISRSEQASKPSAGQIDVCVGLQIRKRRKQMGISQGRLAGYLGLTYSQVQKYERGARISIGRLFVVARFLMVPMEYFFVGLEQELWPENAILRPIGLRSDLATLENAFLSISDLNERSSFLKLVRAIASEGDVD